MRRKAFTMIEIMVTLAIVAILAAVAVASYNTYSIKSKWSEVQSCISDTAIRLENYRSNHGIYPSSDDWDAINSTGSCGDYYAGNFTTFNDGSSYIIVFKDSVAKIGPSGNGDDVWAMIDTGTTIYHVTNSLDTDDVDALPDDYADQL